MTYDDIKKYFGSCYQFSLCCNFSFSSPANWKKQGFIPFNTQVKIEKLTRGKLKASLEDGNPEFKNKEDK
jgi:hypothetical protein